MHVFRHLFVSGQCSTMQPSTD